MPKVRLHKSWLTRLEDEFSKPYFVNLTDFVREEYLQKKIYPPPARVFAALDDCPFESVRVVILGQDPYHGPGQANGLSFSVAKGIRTPPSLQNIYKELQSDLGLPIPSHGDLTKWSTQGILLLNATLTVEERRPGSHQKKGWEDFTDAIINILSKEREGLVFLLWGAYAQKKGAVIDAKKHLVLSAPHPSPYSAHSGFFGSRHFSQTNDFLIKKGQEPIDWLIE